MVKARGMLYALHTIWQCLLRTTYTCDFSSPSHVGKIYPPSFAVEVGKLTFHDFSALSSNEAVILDSGSGRFTSAARI